MVDQQAPSVGHLADLDALETERSSEGVVYVLENAAFATEVVKIGMTGQRDWTERIKNLNGGVPLPFTCAIAYRVSDMRRVEKFLHETFHHAKKHWRGEFFEVEAWRVAQVLRLFDGEDLTASVPLPSDSEAKAIEETLNTKGREENLSFAMVQVPQGAEIEWASDPEVKCRTMNDKNQVEYGGRNYSLSRLTAILKQGKAKHVPGGRNWTYEGETLQERRERFEGQESDGDG